MHIFVSTSNAAQVLRCKLEQKRFYFWQFRTNMKSEFDAVIRELTDAVIRKLTDAVMR
jgi:hypothetical protein